MFDIMKKRKSRRTVQPYSEMPFKKEKPKLSLFSCFRMHKRNKKDIIYEVSDDKLRSKTNEDSVKLNGMEQSNTGMRFNLTCDFDSLQAAQNSSSMGATGVSFKTKQKEQSFADNSRVKELEDCEMTAILSSQDNLDKCVQVIIDCGTCKIMLYSGATYEIKDGAKQFVAKNNKKYGKMRECSTFQPETCVVDKKRNDVQKTVQLNTCRPEMSEDVDEICNQRPTAIRLPTRHHTDTIAVVSPLFVERNTVEVEESNVVNTDDNTAVKTGECSHFYIVDGSSNMEPDPESQSEDTLVKDMDWSSSTSLMSFEDNNTNVPCLQERENTLFEELNWSSLVSFSKAGQETVKVTEDVRTCSRNDNYSEDQKSRNEKKTEAVAGMEMFCQTDAQHQDIQDCYLVHGDNIQSPQESGHSPHSVRVGTLQEGKNASYQHQMFPKLDHDMNCSSMYDMPDSCIKNMSVAKLVQKVIHLESEIGRLSRLVLFAVRSNPRIPDDMKKQDLVISECPKNCKVYLNDDDIINFIKRNLFQVTSPLTNIFTHPECREQAGHSSSACVYLASNSLDLESLQCNRVRQVSPSTSSYIIAEEMNSTNSASKSQEEALKIEKMQMVPKDSKRGEPTNQPRAMLTVERSLWDNRAESDEIGHTLSLLNEENFQHNLDLKQNLEGHAESSLVVELSNIKSPRRERNCTFTEEMIIVEMDDAEKHGPDSLQLKDSEEKEQNHNEDKSRFLQINLSAENLHHNLDLKQNQEGQAEIHPLLVELNKIKSSRGDVNCIFSEEMIIVEMDDAEKCGPDSLQLEDSDEKDLKHKEDKLRFLSRTILAQSINIGHTNRTSVENTENEAQLEMASNSTTPECASSGNSSGYCRKDYTDTEVIPLMECKPTFINSDPDVSCGRESVKDQVWNKQDLEKDETTVNTRNLNLEAADSSFNAANTDESCFHQKENIMGLSSNVLKVKETDFCPNIGASDENCLHQMNNSINISPVKTDPFKFFPEMVPIISDREHIPGRGIAAQHEEYQQRQALVGYLCDHCLQVQDKSKEEYTGESQSIQDSDPEKPRANKFVSGHKVQEEKFKETRSIVHKKKSLRRSKSGVSCRLCPLHRRGSGKKRKVKFKKNMELARKVSHTKNLPGILNDLKILLHYLTSSFAQGTAPSGTLNQATMMKKGKLDFAMELGIVLSAKENGSQERLIDDFLKSLVSTWFIFPTIRNGLQTVILLPTGLQLYFERLLRGTPPEERERMSYEWLRLQTFINYPPSAPGSGIRLARAGFYYSGNGTVTVCYACGGQHSGWNFHDDPYEIHRRISPDCPFLRGNPTYPNVPIMQQEERIGIQMGSNASDMPLSQPINHTTAFQSQNSTITQAGAQSSAATSSSIQNPQEVGLEKVSEQTMSKVEDSLGIVVPSSINPASSAHVDEIPSGIDQPVTLTAEVVPNTSGESQQGQLPTTATTLTRPQQPRDDAENTQYRSPGNFVVIKPSGQVEDPGVDPTPQTMSERPRHPEHAPLSSRINSYTGWPARLDQTPQQMAEAGFFYAGIMDYTRCFQCGGGLRNWEPGDNPWIEHARWYPQCAYVLGKRGQKFVNAVLKKQAELLAAQDAQKNNSNATTTGADTTSKTGTQSTQEPAAQSGQPRYFQNPNENEIANRLINEMGYQRERVREAILEVKRRRGQQEITIEHVIELLIADEERRARAGRQNEPATVEELIQESGRLTLHDDSNPVVPSPTAKTTTTTTQPSQGSGSLKQVDGGRSSGQQQNGQKSGQTNQTSAPGTGPSVPQSRLNMSGPMSIAVDVPSSSSIFGNREGNQSNKSTASNRPSSPPPLEPTSLPAFNAESLREEYLRLRDQNLCKICMERNIELAFLPCGHLVCCEICGQTLRFCPICRAKIHASVKTYLS